MIFKLLAAWFGSVPAKYSCKLDRPSPSGSALASMFVVPKFDSNHATGRPLVASGPGDKVSVCTAAKALLKESQPQFKLTILDSKTHFALWAFTVYAEPANRETTWRKNVDQALMEAVDDVKKLAAQP